MQRDCCSTGGRYGQIAQVTGNCPFLQRRLYDYIGRLQRAPQLDIGHLKAAHGHHQSAIDRFFRNTPAHRLVAINHKTQLRVRLFHQGIFISNIFRLFKYLLHIPRHLAADLGRRAIHLGYYGL